MRRGLLIALTIAAIAGCKEEKSGVRMHPGFGDAGTLASDPISERTAKLVGRASAATVTLRASVKGQAPDRKSYLALREAIAAARPFFTFCSEMGSEVLVGPPRSLDEGGGALGLLDAALRDGQIDEASRQLVQVDRALRLIAHDVALHRVDPKRAVRALSDASYDLGLILAEAYPGVPDGPDAVLADLKGTLEGIVGMAEVAAAKHRSAAPALEELRGIADRLRKTFEGAAHAHALSRRAELIAATGELGVAARRLAMALGVTPKLPHPARRPVKNNELDEPIHALVLPAPRVDPRAGDRAAMIALGKQLFADPRLSKENKRACTDCHLSGHAFGGDTPVATSLDETPIARNTPPLLYTSLHASQLWDGRFASAERQAIRVIHASGEMGLEAGELAKIVAGDEALASSFRKAFGRDATDDDVARALVAYEIDAFVPAASPLDRFARGEREALSDEMHRGFDLFTGKGRCARCHLPPLFGGSRPPDFSIAVYAVLGVPTAPGERTLDADPGRGAITKNPLDQHAFKTPTVRNVAVTAPFFHHGAFPSLEEVLDFYVDGGGEGRGVAVENQDPDVRKLDLDEAEKKSLLIFMREALRDP